MFSVTKRIEKTIQPPGGYIPPSSLIEKTHYDGKIISKTEPAFKSIQGLAVDYLARFLSGTPKVDAFSVSLSGAKNAGELEKAQELLNIINGLDSKSIVAACKLVGYDVAFRRGAKYFFSIDHIKPNKKMIQNIIILVERSIAFLKRRGPVVLDGFTFEGGYNNIVSSGDGDYLTADTLWDFKVSKRPPDKNHTLQILMYYILGVHSVHPEFQRIKKLGIFNPELNVEYTISLSDISSEVFQAVSRDVIGYETPENPTEWMFASGTSQNAWEKLERYCLSWVQDTGFTPNNYGDGIHDITVDDYWSYYRKISETPRPKFRHTHSIKLIKRGEYFMFVSLTEKGTASILQGGSRRTLQKPLLYYYERLPEYVTFVLQNFSKYWDVLYNISKQIQSVRPNEKELERFYKKFKRKEGKSELFLRHSLDVFENWLEQPNNPCFFTGKVHGCIVDIDYFNHIYLDPYTGEMTPYFASSKYWRKKYESVEKLIADKRPDMLPAFNRALKAGGNTAIPLLTAGNNIMQGEITALANSETEDLDAEEEMDDYDLCDSDTTMYRVSNNIKLLQKIYDYKLVVVWLDQVLQEYESKDNKPAALQCLTQTECDSKITTRHLEKDCKTESLEENDVVEYLCQTDHDIN